MHNFIRVVFISIILSILSFLFFYRKQVSVLPTLVIVHLTRRHDRLQNVNRSLRIARRSGFDAKVFSAVEGKFEADIPPFLDMTNNPNSMRSRMRKGEMGCFESHKSCWLSGVDKGVIVMEDDVVLENDALEKMKIHIQDKQHTPSVIYGRFSHPKGRSGVCPQKLERGIFRVTCPCYNANLYYASASACRALVKHAERVMPADDYLSSIGGCHPTKISQATQVHLYSLHPKVCQPMRSTSDTAD